MSTRHLAVPLRSTLALARSHCAANARMGMRDYETREKRLSEERRTLKSWGWKYRRCPVLTGWTALRVGLLP